MSNLEKTVRTLTVIVYSFFLSIILQIFMSVFMSLATLHWNLLAGGMCVADMPYHCSAGAYIFDGLIFEVFILNLFTAGLPTLGLSIAFFIAFKIAKKVSNKVHKPAR